MIFREAFERYKAGNATPEETAYIQEELEKNQLITEYLEDDSNVNLAKGEMPDQELKNVKRAIRKRIRNIILISVTIVIALALLADFVAVPLLNGFYYNPMIKDCDEYTYDIDYSLAAYTELHHAGYYYDNTVIDKSGIGKYTMTLVQSNMSTGKKEYLTATINRNHLAIPYSFSANNIPANIFTRASYPIYNLDSETKENFNKKLKELPDYLNVTAAVSFSEDLTMSQLTDRMANSKVNFLWAGIRNSPENVQQYPLCGMELTGTGVVYEHINDKYPAFELAALADKGHISASDYEAHFISLLQYSIDHVDVPNMLNTDQNYASYYQSILDYVKNNGVKTYGVMVEGSPTDILKLLDTGIVSQIWPQEANISY